MKLAKDPPSEVVECPQTGQLHVIVKQQPVPIRTLARVTEIRHLGRKWGVVFLCSVKGNELKDRLDGSMHIEEGLHDHTLLIFRLCESDTEQEQKLVVVVRHGDDFAYILDGGVELSLLGENADV